MTGVSSAPRADIPTSTGRHTPTVLVVHPGAELFGSDRMLLESVIGLREAGCRVVVGLPSTGPLVDELRSAGAEVEVVPMFVLRKRLLRPSGWPTLALTALRGLVSGWRLIQRVRPAAVYISTTIIPQWPLLARCRRVRSISHVHEAERSGNRGRNLLLYLPHLASHRTLVNSQYTLDTIRWAMPKLAHRCEIVHNGIASPEPPSLPRESLDGALRILYMGRLSPRKAPDLALTAATLLKEAGHRPRLTLLGAAFEGYEWFEQQLRDQAADSGLDVEFAGFRRDIWPYLSETDVLLVPSRDDESFGNTAVEGILALRPVIAADSSGLREAAGGYRTTRLVTTDDARSIACALIDLAGSWPQILSDLAGSRDEALRRHAPAVYRTAIPRACGIEASARRSTDAVAV